MKVGCAIALRSVSQGKSKDGFRKAVKRTADPRICLCDFAQKGWRGWRMEDARKRMADGGGKGLCGGVESNSQLLILCSK
jgi:hypothetical protein